MGQFVVLLALALLSCVVVDGLGFGGRLSINGRKSSGGGGGCGRGGGGGLVPPSSPDFGLSAGDGEGENMFNPKQGALLWLSKLVETYSDLLEKHPYLTKGISSGIVGGSGDVLIQMLQQRKDGSKKFDWRRLFVFSTVAALYIAPVISVWFGYINNLPYPSGMSNLAKASIMILLDQTFGAVFVTFGFFYFFEMVQYMTPPYTGDRSKNFLQAGYDSNKNNLWDTLVANWYCWPWINFFNFLVVPIQYRVLFSNFAAVFWNMFLSSIANRASKKG